MAYGFGTSTVGNTSTGDNNVDGLIADRRWTSRNVTFSFTSNFRNDYEDETGYPNSGTHASSFSTLNTIQRSVTRKWMDMYESVSGLNLIELTGASDRDATIRMAESSHPGTAYAYLPGSSYVSGDIWFNRTSYNSPTMGSYAYHTFGHEIGHALGLEHGHETGGIRNVAMNSNRDSMEFSIMTYRSYVGDPLSGGYSNEAWGYAQSLMMYDIRAIQQMYGANFGHNATGTTYTFSTTTGEMSVNGVGQGTPGGNNIFRTIWDGNGIDTYNFSNYNTNLRVNLAPGGWSDLDVGGNTQRAYLGNGNYARGHLFNALQFNGDTRSLIENAYGGSGNDRIYGNSANNYLRGNDGNDYLYGYDGNDSLNGGSGSDYLSGGTGNDYLYGYDGNDSLYGGSSEDYLSGGNGNDTLRGESGGDRIYGGAGNDWIDGGYGLDRMDGGSGIDTLDVRFWSGTYELDMNTGETNFAGETATNFENVYTGAGNDKITGTSGANSINTGAGNDTLYGENGNDTLTGGKGNDYLVGGLGDDYLNGTDYSAQGTGERDILRSGSFGDRDIFVLGERKGGGRVFYNDNGNSDYALIKDFDVHNFVGDVADKIQLLGSSSSYSIADVSVNGVLGAGINFFGDLIGIVQDFSASSLNLSDSKQFIYV